METIKLTFKYALLGVLMTLASCKEEEEFYPVIESVPCSQTNVAVDPAIISDFECQANVALTGVDAILNPDESGVDTSRFVGKYTDPSAPWDALIIDYDNPIDLSTYNVFTIKIWAPVAGPFIAKLEGGTSAPVEISTDITTTNQWVEYTFDFSDQFNQDHTSLVLFFNAGVDTAGTDVYYVDDLQYTIAQDPCVGVTADPTIINDFDCQQNIGVPEVEIAANPTKSDLDDSKFAGKYVDETGAWDAIIIDYGGPIDLTTYNEFKIKVIAPVAGVLKAKLEGGTSNPIEVDANISVTREWVEYSYDFSSVANDNFTTIVLFFNAGVDTDGTDVYYIDDLRFAELSDPCNGIMPDLAIVNDFDCQQNTIIPGFLTNTIVENPDKSTVDDSDYVLEVIDDGTQPFDALIFSSASAFDLSTDNYLKIKVWSEKEVPLLAKLEGGTSAPKEVFGVIDVVGEWKEYTFDFSDQASENHTSVVFFFNAGATDGTTADTYYTDDIGFAAFDPCAGIVPDLSIVDDFECQQNYAITCCIDTAIIDNPDASGIDTSSKVLEVTDNGTEAYDALVFALGSPIDLSTKNQLKIKVWSTRAVPLLAKLEGGTSTPVEIFVNIDTENAWAEYTVDFGAEASENHQSIVFFFNGGESDGTAADTYYIDDIQWE